MTTLLIATRNRHKVAEIRAMLGGTFSLLTLEDFPDAPETVEDAATFSGNAVKKAAQLARWIRENSPAKTSAANPALVLADDSGLEVDALGGAPGVHSARFAALDQAENSPDADNNAKLLRLLKDLPLEKRTARFRCVLALVETATGDAQWFDGACEGKILSAPRGENGFGYDPLFVPDGFDRTFAELGEDIKNRLSHRAQALDKLKAAMAT